MWVRRAWRGGATGLCALVGGGAGSPVSMSAAAVVAGVLLIAPGKRLQQQQMQPRAMLFCAILSSEPRITF